MSLWSHHSLQYSTLVFDKSGGGSGWADKGALGDSQVRCGKGDRGGTTVLCRGHASCEELMTCLSP